MVGTRLFIGGLSPDLDEASLKQQLANYGAVLSIDVKDKKDIITGEVVKRFAFATLDGSHASIEKCIYSLNGSTLCGGTLSVERAQESFIERLKREREARAAGKPVLHHDNNSGTNFASNYFNRKENNYDADYSSLYNNGGNYLSHENGSWNENSSYEKESKWSNYNSTNGAAKPTLSKDAMDVDLLPSLASYSSAWRDDDEFSEHKYGQTDARTDQSTFSTPRPAPKLPVMRRYDPTRVISETQAADATSDAPTDASKGQGKVTPAVCITKDLVFSGASGTFSLLDMIEGKLDSPNAVDEKSTNERKSTEGAPADPAVSMMEGSEVPAIVGQETLSDPKKEKSPRKTSSETATKIKARKPYVKKHKFFIDAEDACIQEGLTWLYEEISEEAREEFRLARPAITSLYVGRQRRAAAERGNKGAASLTHEWWWSGHEGDEEASVEPATLVSEVLSGVASTVRTSFAEEKRSRDGTVKRAVTTRHFPRGRGRGHARGRGLPWGGRGGFRGRSTGRARGGSKERG
ncbi:RNA recognition motif domain [Trinorchestia longiramus]|nr:RNA recognition motif domain [Trinorchestia longiramus]